MSSRGALPPSAIRLVLAALEAPLARLSPSALTRRAADAEALIESGIIKPGGHEPVTTAADDFSDTPVAVSWDQNRGSFGYFSGIEGWREVPGEQITYYDVEVVRFLTVLLQKCDVSLKTEAIVPDYLWQVGSARSSNRPKRTPLWFGRRLFVSELWRKMETTLRNRASQDRRIILTSTDVERIPTSSLRCMFISIADIVDTDMQLIDPAALSIRLGDVRIQDVDGEPIKLIDDARTVILLGQTFRIRGLLQRDLIKRLHSHYLIGEHPVACAKLLEDIEAGDQTRIKDLFRRSPAWGHLLMERRGMCGFCLPGVLDQS
jgi:hypothetical protein